MLSLACSYGGFSEIVVGGTTTILFTSSTCDIAPVAALVQGIEFMLLPIAFLLAVIVALKIYVH